MKMIYTKAEVELLDKIAVENTNALEPLCRALDFPFEAGKSFRETIESSPVITCEFEGENLVVETKEEYTLTAFNMVSETMTELAESMPIIVYAVKCMYGKIKTIMCKYTEKVTELIK